MNKYKWLLLMAVMFLLTGCAALEFFTPGENGEPSAFEGVAGTPWATYLSGGLLALLAKTVSSGVRFKRAIFEATDTAINNGSLSSAETKKELKEALNEGQTLHNDSKLLAKEYKKFREGGLFSKAISTVKKVLLFWKK